ncbi:PHA/PHB synthase family protein [Teredinibacter purpureus]|uniref:PHA/PHB synthase family protein n=1 Tax=Teredinibacter purpureus TaxID=2731756 RepID=UPI0005F76EEE|nr:class I poly(R)-hydroxyalkanoic acid synthase [Teredinibacter purpureus]
MIEQERTEILRYIEKFSGVFNDMMRQVIERIIQNQFDGGCQPAADQKSSPTSPPKMPNVKVNAEQFVQQQLLFLEKQQQLWQNAAKSMMGEPTEPIIEEGKDDKRFTDDDWDGNPMFSYIKQAYLLNAEYMHQMVDALDFEDKKLEEQVRFCTRQFVSSMAPSNYVLTNPEVCREILNTEGENLAKGIDNFMRDLDNSPNEAFKITQVSLDAFTLGEDLAYTPGKVIFENNLIQLIQYEPTTDATFENPLLIIPPFINKYYILDLDKKKSMVNWLVGQGYTVFMVSWVNPDHTLSATTFDHYVMDGVIAALDVVQKSVNNMPINVAGYCVGGTLLATAQAYLLSQGDERIHSLTFLTSLFDFSEPGEVGHYISEEMYPLVEKMVQKKGYFDGRILALSFSLLRENNLFWSFFIEHYLKGKDPTPFDILYWNSDSTNIPGEAYLYYLRNMYLDNKLIEAGGIFVKNVPVDLRTIKTPSYCLAAMADHIVLWPAAYKSAQCLGGEKRFVLTESGHVAGVVNPVNRGKYSHWVNSEMPKTHQGWLEGASQQQGSWWQDWHQWLQLYSGKKVAPASVGGDSFPVIENAPGRYVKQRLERVVPSSVEESL